MECRCGGHIPGERVLRQKGCQRDIAAVSVCELLVAGARELELAPDRGSGEGFEASQLRAEGGQGNGAEGPEGPGTLGLGGPS
eukprot:6206593-Alexandrium_andersonii.AAC.1